MKKKKYILFNKILLKFKLKVNKLQTYFRISRFRAIEGLQASANL